MIRDGERQFGLSAVIKDEFGQEATIVDPKYLSGEEYQVASDPRAFSITSNKTNSSYTSPNWS